MSDVYDRMTHDQIGRPMTDKHRQWLRRQGLGNWPVTSASEWYKAFPHMWEPVDAAEAHGYAGA